MIPSAFEYLAPTTLQEASHTALDSQRRGQTLGGGA